MITGDAKETAVSIAKQLKIVSEDTGDNCFTGQEFEQLSKENKKKALAKPTGKVFCRVEPRHKRELVKILIDLVSSVCFISTSLIAFASLI